MEIQKHMIEMRIPLNMPYIHILYLFQDDSLFIPEPSSQSHSEKGILSGRRVEDGVHQSGLEWGWNCDKPALAIGIFSATKEHINECL